MASLRNNTAASRERPKSGTNHPPAEVYSNRADRYVTGATHVLQLSVSASQLLAPVPVNIPRSRPVSPPTDATRRGFIHVPTLLHANVNANVQSGITLNSATTANFTATGSLSEKGKDKHVDRVKVTTRIPQLPAVSRITQIQQRFDINEDGIETNDNSPSTSPRQKTAALPQGVLHPVLPARVRPLSAAQPANPLLLQVQEQLVSTVPVPVLSSPVAGPSDGRLRSPYRAVSPGPGETALSPNKEERGRRRTDGAYKDIPVIVQNPPPFYEQLAALRREEEIVKVRDHGFNFKDGDDGNAEADALLLGRGRAAVGGGKENIGGKREEERLRPSRGRGGKGVTATSLLVGEVRNPTPESNINRKSNSNALYNFAPLIDALLKEQKQEQQQHDAHAQTVQEELRIGIEPIKGE